jgi:glycine cleavage system H protein
VVAVNAAIADQLDRLSADPYGAGWLVKVALAGDGGLGALMDYAAYQEQCAAEDA